MNIAKGSLYWARMYEEQIERGKDYAILQPAIVIQILDFVHITSTERFHTSYHVVEDQDGFRLSDVLELHLIEMPKFRKMMKQGHTIEQALRDPLKKWLLFLSMQREATFREGLEAMAMSDATIEKAFNLWESISKDPDNWAAYMNREMAIRDLNQMKLEGREEGREEERETIAVKLLTLGLPMQQIVTATGLSEDQIHVLEQRLHQPQ